MPKLHHFCFYVDSNDIIDKLYPILKRRKIPIVSGPETLVVAGNRSISFLDPDGNRVEIACNANKFKFDHRKKPDEGRRSPALTRKKTEKQILRHAQNDCHRCHPEPSEGSVSVAQDYVREVNHVS